MRFNPVFTLKENDIVIAGAGPAGCTASMFLSKYKIPHTIIDKAVFPRDKVCGDAISGKSVYVMKELNNGLLQDINEKKDEYLGSWGVKFVAPNGKSIDIPFKSDMSRETHAPGFISKRFDFDMELFRRLDTDYADIVQGAELKEIERENGRLKVSYTKEGAEKEIRCKILLGAEGDRSIVAKKIVGDQERK